MMIPAVIEHFNFKDIQFDAYVPSPQWLQEQSLLAESNTPYWAQVWPASRALCEVLANEPSLIKDKNVLEIAAGLGLPSLLAAGLAAKVTATDINEDAVEFIRMSAKYNRFKNLHCTVLDWNNIYVDMKRDVLLLSDVNYETSSFDVLYTVFGNFLNSGTVILLSTPQRLVAKSFMERLQPWCARQYNIDVIHAGEKVFTSVWVLSGKTAITA